MTRKGKKQSPDRRNHPRDLARLADGPDLAGDGLEVRPRQRVQPASPLGRYAALAVCGLLVLAVFAVFGQTVGHEFVHYDDDQYVSENPHVMRGLTGKGVTWAFTAYYASNWHPLTWLSHMLDCQFYDLKPGGHHLINVLLHAAAAVLLFLALRRMTHALWPSAWVAAVFAVHPLRVESVAWVAERKDVLSGLFFMLTLWLYARYAERPASWGRYLAVVASFALGLTAKPMLVTLPFVLLLLDYWPLRRGLSEGGRGLSPFPPNAASATNTPSGGNGDCPLPATPGTVLISAHNGLDRYEIPRRKWELSPSAVRLILEKLPLFLLAAASSAVTLAAQRGAMTSLEHLPFARRAANAAVAYVAYLGDMFCPTALAAFYPFPQGARPALEVAAAAALLAVISAAVVAARRRRPYLLVGWLWYLGTLLPVIGLVQVGGQARADRYTYLTQIGLYVAIAWGVADVARWWPYRRWALAAVSALAVAGLMVCAWQQTQHWRDSEVLWTRALACTTENPVAHTNLGLALARRGQLAKAIDYYRAALEIMPDYADAHNSLGAALEKRGQVDEAVIHYRKALDIAPDHVEAHNNLGAVLENRGQVEEAIAHCRRVLEIRPDHVEARNNLGAALARRGQVDEAIAQYRKALEIRPDLARVHNNLGLALARRGEGDEAIAHFQRALAIQPDYVQAHNNLGVALRGRGQVDEAIAHYRKALEFKPDHVEAHYNLGVALADRRQIEEAIAHFQRALAIQPDLAGAHNHLGLAFARRGQIAEAIAHFQKALDIKPDYDDARRNLEAARSLR